MQTVFPELKERYCERRIQLIEIDLRRRLTEEEAEHGKVLEVRLDEIERCSPFYVRIVK